MEDREPERPDGAEDATFDGRAEAAGEAFISAVRGELRRLVTAQTRTIALTLFAVLTANTVLALIVVRVW
jgi:hypothetical protein